MNIVRGNPFILKKLAVMFQKNFRLPNMGDYIYDYSVRSFAWGEGEEGTSIYLDVRGIKPVGIRDDDGDKSVFVHGHYEEYSERDGLTAKTEIAKDKRYIEMVREFNLDGEYITCPISYGKIFNRPPRKSFIYKKLRLPSLIEDPQKFLVAYEKALIKLEMDDVVCVIPITC